MRLAQITRRFKYTTTITTTIDVSRDTCHRGISTMAGGFRTSLVSPTFLRRCSTVPVQRPARGGGSCCAGHWSARGFSSAQSGDGPEQDSKGGRKMACCPCVCASTPKERGRVTDRSLSLKDDPRVVVGDQPSRAQHNPTPPCKRHDHAECRPCCLPRRATVDLKNYLRTLAPHSG